MCIGNNRDAFERIGLVFSCWYNSDDVQLNFSNSNPSHQVPVVIRCVEFLTLIIVLIWTADRQLMLLL